VTSSYTLSELVLPPTALVVLTLVGVALLPRRRRLALALIAGSQCALLVLSLPVVALALARPLEPPPLQAGALQPAQAIVILGGGRNRSALEWGGETVNDHTLERMRYGARLARETKLPVYVTGGKPSGGVHPEGLLMRDVLEREFGVDVRWVDNAANTTRDNALMAARDLLPAGVRRVALVTTAMHMPRSRQAFAAAGFDVIPAPTDYEAQRPFTPSQLVPGLRGLRLSHIALREWVAIGYYRLLGS
jgi:uncharacterized SAM-binding protein YcdF (DUF218 family)